MAGASERTRVRRRPGQCAGEHHLQDPGQYGAGVPDQYDDGDVLSEGARERWPAGTRRPDQSRPSRYHSGHRYGKLRGLPLLRRRSGRLQTQSRR